MHLHGGLPLMSTPKQADDFNFSSFVSSATAQVMSVPSSHLSTIEFHQHILPFVDCLVLPHVSLPAMLHSSLLLPGFEPEKHRDLQSAAPFVGKSSLSQASAFAYLEQASQAPLPP